MVFGDAAVSQLIQEHRYRPRTSHGVSLRPRRTRVKRSLGRDHELSYASTRRLPFAPARNSLLIRHAGGTDAVEIWPGGAELGPLGHRPLLAVQSLGADRTVTHSPVL